MLRVQLHNLIRRLFFCYYLFGFWHQGDVETSKERRSKILISIYYLLFLISNIAGAVASDNRDDKVFLIEVTIMCIVLLVKLWYIIWRKRETLELLDRICDYNVEDRETFDLVNSKLKKLMKFCAAFFTAVLICGIYLSFFEPLLRTEKKLFVNFGFPLDWKNNDLAYWLANLFFATQMIIVFFGSTFSVITWYLMANCGCSYVVVGQRIRKMGEMRSAVKIKISKTQKDTLYQRHLIETIASHSDLQEYFT